MNIIEDLADQLERQFGPCPAPRQNLLDWVDDQLNRVTHAHDTGEAALAAINDSYVEWRAELLGTDTAWESAPPVGLEFDAMPDLYVPNNLDQDDSEIEKLFEGKGDKKSN